MTHTTLDAVLPQTITVAARVVDAHRTYGVEATSVHGPGGATAGLAAVVGVLAAIGPARRASRVDLPTAMALD